MSGPGLAVAVTAIWSAVASVVLLFILDKLVGLRATAEDEEIGLDLSDHDERGYII